MTVLISVDSRHGSTAGIGERIAEVLRAEGLEVTLTPPGQVSDLEGVDALVLGAAIYYGSWPRAARGFADRFAGALPGRTWAFSSGPLGSPPRPAEDPPSALEAARRLGAVDHAVFPGKLGRAALAARERLVISALKAPDGDFRPWERIEAWARDIARRLEAGAR